MTEQYPLRERSDTTLERYKVFALALYIREWPQAVVGDVWKHQPDIEDREKGFVACWQVSIYKTPEDLQHYDRRLAIAAKHTPNDDIARLDAREKAKRYGRDNRATYHAVFIGEDANGFLFLQSTIEDVERIQLGGN